ncbi:hypothetical protein [Alkalispirochaeta alkalica]|nr:hypothetical protein [Alkalispirochaeta alkalica]
MDQGFLQPLRGGGAVGNGREDPGLDPLPPLQERTAERAGFVPLPR